MNKPKLLIVDDDKDMLALISTFLKDEGYEIITARRGDEAYNLVSEHQPDLALIDGLIPIIHGFELCKKIKEDETITKKPKIIIMSSVYKSMKYKFETMDKFMADDYLVKPFSKEQLVTMINKHTRDVKHGT